MATESVDGAPRRWVTPADLARAMRALGGAIRDPDRTDLIDLERIRRRSPVLRLLDHVLPARTTGLVERSRP